ncbi:MAG: YjbQ family protein [Planctomycetia bacterium]|nr:YjbQ family protein [Planctomycetia bacterium]
MKQVVRTIAFETHAPFEFVDITSRVRAEVRSSGIRSGAATIVSRHTTGGVAVNERDPELQADMVDWLRRTFPPRAGYRHDVEPVDDRLNAHAHLACLALRASETLLVKDGDLDLGAWQAVFFVECDGGRAREVALLVRGEP